MEIFRTSNHKVLLKNRKNKSLFKIQLKLRRSRCDGNSFMCFPKEMAFCLRRLCSFYSYIRDKRISGTHTWYQGPNKSRHLQYEVWWVCHKFLKNRLHSSIIIAGKMNSNASISIFYRIYTFTKLKRK